MSLWCFGSWAREQEPEGGQVKGAGTHDVHRLGQEGSQPGPRGGNREQF